MSGDDDKVLSDVTNACKVVKVMLGEQNTQKNIVVKELGVVNDKIYALLEHYKHNSIAGLGADKESPESYTKIMLAKPVADVLAAVIEAGHKDVVLDNKILEHAGDLGVLRDVAERFPNDQGLEQQLVEKYNQSFPAKSEAKSQATKAAELAARVPTEAEWINHQH